MSLATSSRVSPDGGLHTADGVQLHRDPSSSPPPPPSSSSSSSSSRLFSSNFTAPLDVQPESALLGPDGHRITLPSALWVLESQGGTARAYTAGGTLRVENNGGHCVLWLNKPFPPNADVRFGVRPANLSGGLNIVFHSAAPPTSTKTGSIFDLSLPARWGNYSNYYNGLAVSVMMHAVLLFSSNESTLSRTIELLMMTSFGQMKGVKLA